MRVRDGDDIRRRVANDGRFADHESAGQSLGQRFVGIGNNEVYKGK